MTNSFISQINNISKSIISYDNINSHSTIKMRNIKNGITLNDAVFYRFQQSHINNTQQSVVDDLNYGHKHFSRQAYYSKEGNIPIYIYNQLLTFFINMHKSLSPKTKYLPIAVDGTNNNIDGQVCLNMCFYDITNSIPLDITFSGASNRNCEVKEFKKYLTSHPAAFSNAVFVCDRAYSSHKLMTFLTNNNYHYVLRLKKNAKLIGDNNYRIITHTNFTKTILKPNRSKKSIKTLTIERKQTQYLITNLDNKTHSDSSIIQLYRSRWAIETFFKLLKSNYKFQFPSESLEDAINKSYLSDLSVICIMRLIETYYVNINNNFKKVNMSTDDFTYKPNYSNMIKGIHEKILYKIINADLSQKDLDEYCNTYIHFVKNKTNRSYPRRSKKPFTKWYVKEYSHMAEMVKIINAIKNGTINELNKNQKLKTSEIITINNKSYG